MSFVLKDVLRSSIDSSINFIFCNDQGQILESRFVQRDPDKFIIYLSSQTGCEQACRFCHLTQMGHNKNVSSTSLEEFSYQAVTVLRHMEIQSAIQLTATKISFNFMARGEPFVNSLFQTNPDRIYATLTDIAAQYGYTDVDFKVSSILPRFTADDTLSFTIPYRAMLDRAIFQSKYDVRLYYSLYSTSAVFRKHWMPRGLSPESAGQILFGTSDRLVLHQAFISDENDSTHDVEAILNWMYHYRIKADVNLVRYNPFSVNCGREAPASRIENCMETFAASAQVKTIQLINRVGLDVSASCGMFVTGEE